MTRLSFIDTIVMIGPQLIPHLSPLSFSLLAHTCRPMHTLIVLVSTRQHRRESEANRQQREEIRSRILELRARRGQLEPEVRHRLDLSLTHLYVDFVYPQGPRWEVPSRGIGLGQELLWLREKIETLVDQGAQYSIVEWMNVAEALKYDLTINDSGDYTHHSAAENEAYQSKFLRFQFELYRLALLSSPYHLYLLSSSNNRSYQFSVLQLLFRAVFPSRHPINAELREYNWKHEVCYSRKVVTEDKHAPWNHEWRDDQHLTRSLFRAGIREFMEWCINLHYVCSSADGHLVMQSMTPDAVLYYYPPPPNVPFSSFTVLSPLPVSNVAPSGRDVVMYECIDWLPNAFDPMLLKSSYHVIEQEKEKEANFTSSSTACVMKRQEEHFYDRMYEWRIIQLCLSASASSDIVLPLSDSPLKPVVPPFSIYSTSRVPTSHQLYTRVDEHVKMQQPRNAYEKVSPPLDEKEIDLTPKLFTHTRMDLTCTLPIHRLDLTMYVLTSHQFRCAFHHSFHNLQQQQQHHQLKEQSRFISRLFDSFFGSQESRRTFSHLITNGTLVSFLKPFQDESDDDGRSKSSISSSSSSTSISSNGARSHNDWNVMLSNPHWRRLFEFVYFDLIRRKETKLIKLIHRYINTDTSGLSYTHLLREPITQLSPLMYLIVEVRSITTAYRLFDLLVHESLLAHEMSIERVLDDERRNLAVDGNKSLRELLHLVKNVELLDRIHKIHSTGGNINNSSAEISHNIPP